MVERILDAAARILVVSGYDGASTHRIAAEAGISPGSLYQYFANKDTIVAATVERMIEQIGAELVEAFEDVDRGYGTDQVRHVVAAVLDATERNRELVRVLVEQMPRLGGSTEIKTIERRANDLASGYLAGITQDAGNAHRPAMVWMAVQALQQITIRYVLDRPSIAREDFIDALTRLITTFTATSLS
ncbi:TetR/AcrR family transcriptional regulator [Mycolicibacterium baixiangningiae]|uniref:TetR/AcrR family transcriptional regulator n=1 Tax=Mycolicibacterium baixiangningiae TaxID=2761578 RepID=UPI001866C002|nr:TetR/AcrR family transcriptional regulator [Mycolicibacterium baixiangningiae]